MKDKSFIFLAKLGIIESTDKNGKSDIQRIDDPQDFKDSFNLNFIPPLLSSDLEAKAIFNNII